jgi:hypothetical protein
VEDSDRYEGIFMVGPTFQKLFNNQNEGCEPVMICSMEQESGMLFIGVTDVTYVLWTN